MGIKRNENVKLNENEMTNEQNQTREYKTTRDGKADTLRKYELLRDDFKKVENERDILRTEKEKILKEKNELEALLKKAIIEIKESQTFIKKDKEEAIKRAEQKVLNDFCDVLDDFERANRSQKDDTFVKGVEKILNKLTKALKKNNVVKLDIEEFDPTKHEAIAAIPSNLPEGQIIEIVNNGYKMGNKVIKYARVVLSNGEKI